MNTVVCLECRRLGFCCAGCTWRGRRRWQDSYRIGDRAEVLLTLTDGQWWHVGTVVRKLAGSGFPVVRIKSDSSDHVVVYETEIRKT